MSFSIDFTPILNNGFGYANVLLVGLGGLLALGVGFALFKWLWRMIMGVVANLGGG